mmetsp:Transcript_71263/g.230792  ORF Transcript_71263/g.230792 Transcript_71263/m.230792 type:complete len:237 (+) Transcript_71263:577-1287(+)
MRVARSARRPCCRRTLRCLLKQRTRSPMIFLKLKKWSGSLLWQAQARCGSMRMPGRATSTPLRPAMTVSPVGAATVLRPPSSPTFSQPRVPVAAVVMPGGRRQCPRGKARMPWLKPMPGAGRSRAVTWTRQQRRTRRKGSRGTRAMTCPTKRRSLRRRFGISSRQARRTAVLERVMAVRRAAKAVLARMMLAWRVKDRRRSSAPRRGAAARPSPCTTWTGASTPWKRRWPSWRRSS